ncbi:B-cell receptor CD22-like [Labrus bergylta]|uniref:B-cell receptor CD22-like n=1 Tax=Labrus bergylta TaxID=56723 RepID=UPI0033143191
MEADAPKLPSVSVSPSAEIVENSTVTLTCSSDANPAANYTWYKKNGNPDFQPLSKGPELVFSSVQSSDSGEFYCAAENDLGRRTSEHFISDVKLSPSAEIVEGSSVTLTCSSDAKPAANYTWFKEDEDSPTASGQIFTISTFSADHSGRYYCEAQNTRGRHNSTLHLLVVAAGGWKLTTAVTVPAIFLIIILIFVVIWIIKKRACKQPSEPGDRPENSEQIQPAEEQDELQYATVDFSRNQADPLYSNIQPVKPQRHKKKKKEEEEGEQEEMVEYSVVNFNSGGAAQR